MRVKSVGCLVIGSILLGAFVLCFHTNERVIHTEAKSYPKPIAITFDDGPSANCTKVLLDELEKRNVKATFFVIGASAEENPDLIKRMSQEGHVIGNHTYSHIALENNNRQEYLAELIKTNELLENITGQEITFVRPPFGRWDKSLEKETNLIPVLWSVDPMDWCTSDTCQIVEAVVKKAKENDIILLHDNYMTSVQAALSIIDILRENNYYFVTVDELMFD